MRYGLPRKHSRSPSKAVFRFANERIRSMKYAFRLLAGAVALTLMLVCLPAVSAQCANGQCQNISNEMSGVEGPVVISPVHWQPAPVPSQMIPQRHIVIYETPQACQPSCSPYPPSYPPSYSPGVPITPCRMSHCQPSWHRPCGPPLTYRRHNSIGIGIGVGWNSYHRWH